MPRAQTQAATSKLLGAKMLAGWTMLAAACPDPACRGTPLMQLKGKPKLCVCCSAEYDAHGHKVGSGNVRGGGGGGGGGGGSGPRAVAVLAPPPPARTLKDVEIALADKKKLLELGLVAFLTKEGLGACVAYVRSIGVDSVDDLVYLKQSDVALMDLKQEHKDKLMDVLGRES